VNFQSFLATLKADLFLAVLPLAGKTATAIAANPSALNVAAQWAALNVEVLTTLPQLEQTVAVQLAQAVNAEIETLITKAQTGAVSASVTTAGNPAG
jgi:hypothetical protein